MIAPPALKSGDCIRMVAPARKISLEELNPAIKIIESRGFQVRYDPSLFAEDHQYAGSDQHRLELMQQALDEDDTQAILFARGGYGSVRIVDALNFDRFIQKPKWLIGYSDITVFHNHVNRQLGIQSLHASMPMNFPSNTSESLDSLFQTILGKDQPTTFARHKLNRTGVCQGTLCGGNLSVLYSLLGSPSFPETTDSILFLEDLDEYLYHIDRMMQALKRSGVLARLSGLVVGAMSEMNDNLVPFGKTAYEIIKEAVSDYSYPVYFGFPSGHIADNRAIIMGAKSKIEAVDGGSILKQND